MNIIAKVVVSLVVVAAPALSFAQGSSEPLTRAQVKAELVQIEQAGYSVGSGDSTNYPADIQAAEAKVAAQQNTNETNEAYGGMHESGAASGTVHRGAASSSSSNACVGPADFCVPFFGS
ncbi:DUF4148 domain-containing protein [Caballeronia sp. GAWG2-1]|uniref:DUF4148 domain-containing protein n=1 Tax=Caballeronia sp. GAWG2-1 TaxID=2921744 RepID=UPI0020294795|nr:DUF4148 domain-containing protein [Caballeronia sp. GAWG2-1]